MKALASLFVAVLALLAPATALAQARGAAAPVTVTLVRWPYT